MGIIVGFYLRNVSCFHARQVSFIVMLCNCEYREWLSMRLSSFTAISVGVFMHA
jgi:hypothetical protein